MLWSSDSKRFAYLSSNLTVPSGNLFSKPPPLPQKKQTTVYHLSGDSFSRIDLPMDKPPGREDDAEIKGAVVGHEFIEPMKWSKANELILERHDYYESLAASGSVHGFDRLYVITVVLREDGSADTTWKRRQNR